MDSCSTSSLGKWRSARRPSDVTSVFDNASTRSVQANTGGLEAVSDSDVEGGVA